ncbi:phosphatase PAP2 family protein [Bordetella sp. FB-8]|uniref:phosphatase PAP2 family protein n=1 Tax=Bordetella sp. FB-8 TaxID=1159870 RepID=UPI00035D9EE9|nr:phosphatase PAP2 family protein [Bordetella sp. FB-8]
MHVFEPLNRVLFLVLNGTPATPHWLVFAGIFIANDLIWLAPAMLVYLWLTGNGLRRELAVRACCVGFLALGINQLIGMAWYHPRPFVIGLGHAFLAHAPDSSFPSDHVTLLSSLAFTFLLGGERRLGLLALIADLAVAWARVFVGVHFPFDMIGAALVACLAYGLVRPCWNMAGLAATGMLIALYRKLLALPIRRRWLRP